MNAEAEPLTATAGIKMERLCELALNVKPDWENGTIDCAVPFIPHLFQATLYRLRGNLNLHL